MKQDEFLFRHLGINKQEEASMLQKIGVSSMQELIKQTIPENILTQKHIKLPQALSEQEVLIKLKKIAEKNKIYRSFIGQGFYPTNLPAVIQRHVLENASWYTSYTPYQAEISQGHLEALLNFQTMVTELTGMDVANCSLLDEATAAAEAMNMMWNARPQKKKYENTNFLFVDKNVFPHTKEVIKTRAKPLNIELVVDNFEEIRFSDNFFGAIVQYPDANGEIKDYSSFISNAHENEVLVATVVDLMSLCLLVPPSDWGANIVVGTTQRFGIPMGFGGPHAAFLACSDKLVRYMPGRIIGISKDVSGHSAYRMSLQTREQHIKRERATSNICTAQALLASMAGFYAVYHGYKGLIRIATHIHLSASCLATKISEIGYKVVTKEFFGTIQIQLSNSNEADLIKKLSLKKKYNFCYPSNNVIEINTDEQITINEINNILHIFATAKNITQNFIVELDDKLCINPKFLRKNPFLQQSVFQRYQSETAMMRYIKSLEKKDIALNTSMIPLGSCTMKLNPSTALFTITWEKFSNIHPFAPKNQTKGYLSLISKLEKLLCRITGFNAFSLQPNSGASGEYVGLLIISKYFSDIGENHRNIVLIPRSAHGTNPASCNMAGLKAITIKSDKNGNIDIEDLKEKANKYTKNLCAFMITYPSTHGVFESNIKLYIKIIHDNGGLVYFDGANMNAMCGLSLPAEIGADICHLNLHKTFGIPHGGGGPGIGPVGTTEKLKKYLPNYIYNKTNSTLQISAITSASFGSASILPISYVYILMLGYNGLKRSSEIAILNANYLSKSLEQIGLKTLYKGTYGRVAHEFILDTKTFRKEVGITDIDIAKRLMDFGFHAPTLSFPVMGTLMIEPTESEPKEALDKFIQALKCIYTEIQEIKNGAADKTDNVLKNAPHTFEELCSDEWQHKYTRKKAAFPLSWVKKNKFFVPCKRLDDAYGDRHLVCTCQDYMNTLTE